MGTGVGAVHSEGPGGVPGRETRSLLRERGPCGLRCPRDQCTALSSVSICLDVGENPTAGQTSQLPESIQPVFGGEERRLNPAQDS